MATLKQAVAYARYSSDRQSARSIDDQFLLCDKIAKQNGYKIVKYFDDRAIGGAGTLGRAGWLALMRAVTAKDRTFDAVVIESLSRMSRDLADSARDFKRITHKEIELIDLEGSVNTMRVGMSGIMNQEFRKHLGNMVRRAWDGRVSEGLIPGKPAFGHRLIPGKPFEREADPEQAKIVNRIFAEFANREPLREIAARLNADGIPSPSGGKWNHTVFIAGGGNGKGILANRIYIGELVWNNNRSVINPETEKRNKRKGKPEDLLTVPVPHLRIIDQDLWDRVQALRVSRNRQTGVPAQKKTIIQHMLAGKLFCGACGGGMKVCWSKPGEHSRIGCTNARNKGICINSKSYDLVEIEATVLHGVKHNLDVEALMAYTEGAHEEWTARRRETTVERDAVERALNRCKEKIDRIVTALAESDTPVKPLMEKLKALELEHAGLASKLEQFGPGSNVVALHPAAIQRFRINLETLHDHLTNHKLTNDEAAPYRITFSNVFDRVVVHPTGKRKPVEVTPYATLSAILGTEFFPTMRTPQKIFEDQGLTNKLLVTQGTLGHQKLNIIGLGRWRQAA
jgi:site-specific DNA recombinase